MAESDICAEGSEYGHRYRQSDEIVNVMAVSVAVFCMWKKLQQETVKIQLAGFIQRGRIACIEFRLLCQVLNIID